MKTLRVPLLVFALPAMLIAFASARHGQLLLARDALADGEVWRLWSGHWIHFSASHLAWNLAVLLAAGAWLERVRPGLLLHHTVVAAPLIGVAVLAFEPALQTYGGLSGLATGVVVLLGLHQFRSPGSTRGLWLGVLALVFVKSAIDLAAPTAWLAHFATLDVRTSSTAHAAGAITAVLHFTVARGQGGRRDAPIPQVTRTPHPGGANTLQGEGAPVFGKTFCASRVFCGNSVWPENDTAGTRDGLPAARFRRLPLTTGWTHKPTNAL